MDYISLQERIAHLQKTVEQKNLDLARLQGQVVDMESIRASNEALLVKKTQVECERDDLQKKYLKAVKKVGDMEKVTEKYTYDDVHTFKKVNQYIVNFNNH